MLQVARLAPKQLGESSELVAGFLRGHLNPDGGFQNRSGASDLYYTVFGLDALIALQQPVPEKTAGYLTQFEDGAGLDFVHLACLARAWSALRHEPDSATVARMIERVESFRSDDGGYDTTPGAPAGSAYGTFMALGAYQDLGRGLPSPAAVLESLQRLRTRDGSYGISAALPTGVTTLTAAAVVATRHLGGGNDRAAGMWLLDRCHSSGGFFAFPGAPVPDLLSTATALHALSALHVPIGGIREACLDFVDSLWTNRGGFFGTWEDDAPDCEYTFYALLALGHLSLAST